MRTALVWVISRVVVISVRHFGTTYWPHLRGSKILFRGQEGFLSLEDGTNRLSQNVREKLPLLAAKWGHAVVQWVRHCATNRKVTGSSPDGAIGIFHCHNPSGCTMALGSTQPLTEMSTRSNSWGVKAASA
jgi:hypothetical protein